MKVFWMLFMLVVNQTVHTRKPTWVILPLFKEQSKSPAMIRHAMDIIKKAVEYFNPGQTPVITYDQPLYAVPKLIQWNFAEPYGKREIGNAAWRPSYRDVGAENPRKLDRGRRMDSCHNRSQYRNFGNCRRAC